MSLRTPSERSARRTSTSFRVLRFLATATVVVIGIVAIVVRAHPAAADNPAPVRIATPPLQPVPLYASYRGHRIYQGRRGRYYISHKHRHFLPPSAI